MITPWKKEIKENETAEVINKRIIVKEPKEGNIKGRMFLRRKIHLFTYLTSVHIKLWPLSPWHMLFLSSACHSEVLSSFR